jgi:hypothetical protein
MTDKASLFINIWPSRLENFSPQLGGPFFLLISVHLRVGRWQLHEQLLDPRSFEFSPDSSNFSLCSPSITGDPSLSTFRCLRQSTSGSVTTSSPGPGPPGSLDGAECRNSFPFRAVEIRHTPNGCLGCAGSLDTLA